MIILITHGVNEITQKQYDELIESLDLSLLRCPGCHHCGTVVHAYYGRILKYRQVVVELIVLRVKCCSCGKTHAILPDSIVPYSWIPLESTIEIINADSTVEINEILDTNSFIDLSDIRRVRRNFRNFWKERLKSSGLLIDSDISRNCIDLFLRQFMQIRCTVCGSYG